MKFFDLLILMGMKRDVRPAAAGIWLISVMSIGAIVFIAVGLKFILTDNVNWLLILPFLFFGIYASGRVFGILDSGSDRSGLRDIGKIFIEMNLIFVDRDQPLGKFVVWRAIGFVLAVVLMLFLMRVWLDGGNALWVLAVFPVMLVYYFAARHFGHFR